MGKFEDLCRRSVPEGIVLLQTNGTLPLKATDKVALFGRAQFEYQKSGTGSGGLVCCPYVTQIGEELAKRVAIDKEVSDFYQEFIAKNPFDEADKWFYPPSQKQPELDESFVKVASQKNNKAIYVLSRLCGESYDCKVEKGNWYLSNTEEQNIQLLRKHFPNLIVLIQTGNIMDMSWVEKYDIKTVAYIWQGGQEGGLGTVDALMGDASPSGRLVDTIAKHIDYYPTTANFGNLVKNVHVEDIYVGYRYFESFAKDHVLYPFGYGLSYTQFSHELLSAKKAENLISLQIKVKNVGDLRGKEVVQVYFEAPQGALGKPKRELIAFKKTDDLQPNSEEIVNFEINLSDMASYDDSGKSGFAFAYVLEGGEYKIYSGKNVREAKEVFKFALNDTLLVKQCSQALAPIEPFERIINKNGKPEKEQAPLRQYSINERIKAHEPKEIPYTGNLGITLKDVDSGKNTLDEFIAQVDAETLCQIVRGEGMSSPKGAMPGTASCFAGVGKDWRDLGVPVLSTCDGPSGIRLQKGAPATCIPSGTMIASVWSPELFEGVYSCLADEMLKYHIDVLLGPGINIHRNPLCGRNFEYYSEDPYLTGECAKAIAKIFTKKGVYCTLKHFAVNSQEEERASVNEVVSERALREIYLKGFEIAVKSGCVQSIMTAYNRINGTSAAGNYDLTTTILRNEWGYKGFVMTDWWTKIDCPVTNTFRARNLATMIKAQNDIYMCLSDAVTHDDDLKESLKSGYLSVSELQRSAKNILEFTLKSHSFTLGDKTIWHDDMYAEKEVVYVATNLDGDIKPGVLENTYVAEIEYQAKGDTLQQIDLKIEAKGREDITVTVNKTGDSVKKARFYLYLQVGTVLKVKSKEIISLKILK